MSLAIKILDNLMLDIAQVNPSTAKQLGTAIMDGRGGVAVVRTTKCDGLDAGQVTVVVKQDSDRLAYFAYSTKLNKLVPVDPRKVQPLIP